MRYRRPLVIDRVSGVPVTKLKGCSTNDETAASSDSLVANAVTCLLHEPQIPWCEPRRTCAPGVEPGVPVCHRRPLVVDRNSGVPVKKIGRVLDPCRDEASATTTCCRRPGGEQQDLSVVSGHWYVIPPSVHCISAPVDLSAPMASSQARLECQLGWRKGGATRREHPRTEFQNELFRHLHGSLSTKSEDKVQAQIVARATSDEDK